MGKRVLLFFSVTIIVGLSCNKSTPTGPANLGWTECEDLQGYSITGFGASGGNLIAGAYQGLSSYAYIFLSTDNGLTWKLDTAFYVQNTFRNPPLTMIPHVTLFANGTDLFAAIGGVISGSVYFSSNRGVTWSEKDTSFRENINCIAVMGTTLFAGSGGVFRSTDNGTSWSTANTGPSAVSGLAVVGSNIFACTEGSGIYRSNDRGANWVEVNSTDYDFHSLVTIGSNIFAGFPGGYSDGGVLKSTDNGTSWTVVDNGLTDSSVNVLFASGSNLFAGTNVGIFLSTNSGASWMDISGGSSVDSLGAISLGLSGSYLFAGTNSNGAWRCPISGK